ncbi:MAG: hypothetical protein QOK28_2410 [Actinomycetota bacterium]|jgi:hypothetical protein
MRKFLVVVLPVALLGACGAKQESAADIRAQALTAAEFAPGYKRTSIEIDKRTADPIGCAQLDRVDAKYVKTTAHTAGASFRNGDDRTATQFANETIYTFKAADEANRYFDAEVAGFNACKTFTSTDSSGAQSSYHTQRYAFPTVGDESYASSVTINGVVNGQAQTVAGPIVLVRKQKKFVAMLFFHVGSQPGLSSGDVETIVRKAAGKL